MDYADLDPGDAYLMDSVDNTGLAMGLVDSVDNTGLAMDLVDSVDNTDLAMDLVDSVDNTGLVDWDMAGDDKAHKALVVHIPSII